MIIGLIIAIPSLSKSVRTEQLDAYTNLILRRVSYDVILSVSADVVYPMVVQGGSSDLKTPESDPLVDEYESKKDKICLKDDVCILLVSRYLTISLKIPGF